MAGLTITARLTITIDGDADVIPVVAALVGDYVATELAPHLDADIRDLAEESILRDAIDAEDPDAPISLNDCWYAGSWRPKTTIDGVTIRRHQLSYLCTVCGSNPVDAENGIDTCDSCLAKQ